MFGLLSFFVFSGLLFFIGAVTHVVDVPAYQVNEAIQQCSLNGGLRELNVNEEFHKATCNNGAKFLLKKEKP